MKYNLVKPELPFPSRCSWNQGPKNECFGWTNSICKRTTTYSKWERRLNTSWSPRDVDHVTGWVQEWLSTVTGSLSNSWSSRIPISFPISKHSPLEGSLEMDMVILGSLGRVNGRGHRKITNRFPGKRGLRLRERMMKHQRCPSS